MRKYIFQKFFFSFTQPRLISNKRVEKFANKFSSLFPRFLTRNLWSPQVVELVKYKKERKWNESEGNRTKAKRVPTVKKELSTQKEILIGSSNETTRVSSKSLSPSEVPVNRLNEQLEPIRRRNVVVESSNEVRETRMKMILLRRQIKRRSFDPLRVSKEKLLFIPPPFPSVRFLRN